MANLVWNTPLQGHSIMAAHLGLMRELAVELNRLGKLDDSLLSRVEEQSIKKIKGSQFSSIALPDVEQLRLMDLAIEAIRVTVTYLRANRDKGNLK
jgi:hypothetical protein